MTASTLEELFEHELEDIYFAESELYDVLDTHAQLEDDGIDDAYLLDQLPKSLIAAPEDGGALTPGPVDVVGVAWSGEDPVDRVEVTTDLQADGDGRETPDDEWTEVSLSDPALGRYAWRRFRFRWDAEPGEHVLAARATDGGGRTQPARVGAPDGDTGDPGETYSWNRKGYRNSAYRSYAVRVTVEEDDG